MIDEPLITFTHIKKPFMKIKHQKKEANRTQPEPDTETAFNSFSNVLSSMYQYNLDAARNWLEFIGMRPTEDVPSQVKRAKLG